MYWSSRLRLAVSKQKFFSRKKPESHNSNVPFSTQIDQLDANQVRELNAQLQNYELKPKSGFLSEERVVDFPILFAQKIFTQPYKKNAKHYTAMFLSTAVCCAIASIAMNWYYNRNQAPPPPVQGPPPPPRDRYLK